MKKIILCGGCFWGVQAYFDLLKGVNDTWAVYADGKKDNPSYTEVSHEISMHAEGVLIEFDESIISIEDLLSHYLRFVDPYSVNKQQEDAGINYRTAIFTFEAFDLVVVYEYLMNYFKSNYSLMKIIIKNDIKYFLAEEYHQHYLDKNKNGYCHIDLKLIKDEEIKDERKY
ncbi:MAG: peptide-methionine (S)-S-oxide reductase MsrA [Acholeplasmatales bacterium]|jgi:methionine-S-sulfoxide reductase|nr:peptide-methionine (S)-S-oxide reductase MsrA [Acholeplasmatales bacterium]